MAFLGAAFVGLIIGWLLGASGTGRASAALARTLQTLCEIWARPSEARAIAHRELRMFGIEPAAYLDPEEVAPALMPGQGWPHQHQQPAPGWQPQAPGGAPGPGQGPTVLASPAAIRAGSDERVILDGRRLLNRTRMGIGRPRR